MEKRLREAAMKGSIESLSELLLEDPQILDNTQNSTETPLHIAALLGHSEFAAVILARRPEMASGLNYLGQSALHLAAARGSVEIVKRLVLVNADMCLVRDKDGMIPLHLGAIKGRAGALAELIRASPETIRVLTRVGDSAVHLCVKHCRLEALRSLVDSLGRDFDCVNLRDSEGNNALHLAVSKKQLEMINYLVSNTKVQVNGQNAKGSTAMDVLYLGDRDIRDMAIKQSLKNAGAQRNMDATTITYEELDTAQPATKEAWPTSRLNKAQGKKRPKQTEWLGRKRNSLMIVASLIATIAFQAAISPPGGVWQDDYKWNEDGDPVDDPHDAGKSVMADTQPKEYGEFMIMNTIAFLSSLSIILLLVSGLPLRKRRWMWAQMVAMWISITALSGTAFVGLIYITPTEDRSMLYNITRVSVLVWLPLMGLVFVGNVARMVTWYLRKKGYLEDKPHRDHPPYQDDDDDDEL